MIQPQEYVDKPGFSQSDLKLFRKDVNAFYRQVILKEGRKQNRSKSLDIGDIVDVMLTNTKALQTYAILDNVACSETIKEFIQIGRDTIKNNSALSDVQRLQHLIDINEGIDYVYGAAKAAGYQSRWKEETLRKHIIEEAGPYYKALGEAGDKQVMDGNTYRQAKEVAKAMARDEHMGLHFTKRPGVRSSKQVILSFEYHGVWLKAMLDIVESAKGELWPFDVKTSDSHIRFMISFIDHDYAFQGAVYTLALRMTQKTSKIHPFQFLTGTTRLDRTTGVPAEPPRIYSMSEADIQLQIEGGRSGRGKWIIGLDKTIDDLKWHLENNKWNHPRAYYETGSISLDSFEGLNLHQIDSSTEDEMV